MDSWGRRRCFLSEADETAFREPRREEREKIRQSILPIHRSRYRDRCRPRLEITHAPVANVSRGRPKPRLIAEVDYYTVRVFFISVDQRLI
jgi:hypothetical protein